MRRHLDAREAREHRRVAELLPWHAAGTLEPAEADAVARHLERCAECRSDAVVEARLVEALRARPEAAPEPHPAGLARLLRRIEERRRAARGPASRLRALLAATPATVRHLVLAQAAAVLVLGAMLAWRISDAPPPARFQTLADPAPVAASAGRLRVVFADDLPLVEVRDLLERVGGHIVDGPSPLGAYTLELRLRAGDSPQMALEILRAHPGVRFAERAVIGDAAQ